MVLSMVSKIISSFLALIACLLCFIQALLIWKKEKKKSYIVAMAIELILMVAIVSALIIYLVFTMR